MAEAFTCTEPAEALKHVRLNRETYRAFRRVVLKPELAVVYDINGDALTVDGVGWKTDRIGEFLHGVGATFDPQTVNEPPRTGDEKEFKVVRSDPWGQDRIL